MTTPDRRKLPLLTQQEFLDAYDEIYLAFNRVDADTRLMSDIDGIHTPCRDWFFRKPGAGLVREVLYISGFQNCQGMLFFRVSGGVQPGRWELEIELEESNAEIPFLIEAR